MPAHGHADLSGPAEAPVAVEVTRGGIVESRHRARAVIVDAGGRVLARWGDIDSPIFARSAIKALQAIPLVETGALDAFALGEEEVEMLIDFLHRMSAQLDAVNAVEPES